jgi:hypothetical protein
MARALKIYDGLSPLEVAFCRSCVDQAYDGRVVLTEAYREAGYSCNAKPATIRRNASTVFARPRVQNKIKQMMAHKASVEQHTREYVIGTLMAAVEICMEPEAIENEAGKGQQLTSKPSASYMTAAMRGLELLGKACGGGMFTDRVTGDKEPPMPLPELYERIGVTMAEIKGLPGVKPIKIPAFIERKIKEHAKSSG